MKWLAVLLVFACSSPAKPATPLSQQYAPMLFTVEQLRAGCPKGRVIDLHMEIEGEGSMIEHWEFTAVDETSATISSVTRDSEGQTLKQGTGTSTWVDLHKHGQFPLKTTVFADNVEITVPAGTFKTRRYTVTADGATRRFWFASELPGPPVQFETEKAGKIVMRARMMRAK